MESLAGSYVMGHLFKVKVSFIKIIPNDPEKVEMKKRARIW